LYTAIYAGTFDPITLGHIDIIRRAVKIVDKLVIGVAVDTSKTPIFTLEKRLELVKEDMKNLAIRGKVIEVYGFEGLVVNFAKEHKANMLIRGLRAVSDFEYEFQMSGMNHKLDKELQTVFLPASENTHFIASRFVKEMARLGGDISGLVTENVARNLQEYYLGK
jgi:pantetheine-phosphate adenylyltransferase